MKRPGAVERLRLVVLLEAALMREDRLWKVPVFKNGCIQVSLSQVRTPALVRCSSDRRVVSFSGHKHLVSAAPRNDPLAGRDEPALPVLPGHFCPGSLHPQPPAVHRQGRRPRGRDDCASGAFKLCNEILNLSVSFRLSQNTCDASRLPPWSWLPKSTRKMR